MKLSITVPMAMFALSLGGSDAWAAQGTVAGHAQATACVSLLNAADSASGASAHPSTCSPARELSVTQDNCTMAVVGRGVWMDVLRPLVPDSYGLTTTTAAPGRPPGPYSSIFILDQYCQDVVVHGRRSAPSTTTYVITRVTTVDGQPATTTFYTLYIGTDNPQLFALYRSAGLPVDFLPANSTTITQVGGATQAVFAIQGGEFDHEFTVLENPPVAPYTFDTGATWLYDAPRGRLSLVWDNDLSPNAPAIISGSVEADTTLAELVPEFLHTINNVRFPTAYRTGSHIQTLTRCPQ